MSERLANDFWKTVNSWEPFAKDTIGKQVVRPADSVGANIGEGLGRGSYQDNRRFVKRASRASLNETQHWLRRAYTRNLLTVQQVNELTAIINDLAPQLNSYLQFIGSSPKNHEQ